MIARLSLLDKPPFYFIEKPFIEDYVPGEPLNETPEQKCPGHKYKQVKTAGRKKIYQCIRCKSPKY